MVHSRGVKITYIDWAGEGGILKKIDRKKRKNQLRKGYCNRLKYLRKNCILKTKMVKLGGVMSWHVDLSDRWNLKPTCKEASCLCLGDVAVALLISSSRGNTSTAENTLCFLL